MIEKTFWITNRFGEKLEMLIRQPEIKGKYPAVLFVSGFSMDLHEFKNSNDEISKHLVNTGFTTLQFSFAGRGKSEGNYSEMTLERQARQVEDVIDWFSQQPAVDKNRIGIHATSYGCPASMLAKNSIIKSLCLVSGVYFLDERFEKSLRTDFVSTTINNNGQTTFRDEDGYETTVGPQFWVTNKKFNPLPSAKTVKQSVLMIHGDHDMYIDPENAKKLYNNFSSKYKRFKLFIGGGHGITDVPHPMREEFLREVVKWFNDTL